MPVRETGPHVKESSPLDRPYPVYIKRSTVEIDSALSVAMFSAPETVVVPLAMVIVPVVDDRAGESIGSRKAVAGAGDKCH